MSQPHVLCIGSTGRDVFFPTDAGYILDNVEKPDVGPQWVFGYGEKNHVDNRFQAPGGCACNVSVGLSRLGVAATAWGVIGTDADGAWIKEELLRDNVDVEHITPLESAASDISFILVRADSGERIIFANRDAGEHLQLSLREVAWYPWVFVGSLYGDVCADNMHILHEVITQKKTSLIYNPGMSNIIRNTRLVYNLLHHSSIIFVNKKEAREIIARGDITDADVMALTEAALVTILAEHTDRRAIVVLTYGNHGAWVWHEGKISHVATKDQKIVDTTGAGDAFASGFVAAILSEKSVEEAMRWGSANSNSVIAQYGAHKGLVHKKEMTQLNDDFYVKEVV